MDSPLYRLFQLQSKGNWFDAGLKLGLDQDTLESIRKSHTNDEDCFFAMLNQLPKNPHPPTLQVIGKPQAAKQTHTGLQGILYTALHGFERLHSPPQADRVGCDPTTDIPVYTDLPAVERQQLIVSLQEQTLAIRKKFAELVTATVEELKKSRLPLSSLIGSMQSKNQRTSLFDKATSI